MLLRSSSTPMLNSWVPQSSPEPEFSVQISLKSSKSNIIQPSFSFDINKISRNLTESDRIRGNCSCMHRRFLLPAEDEEEEKMSCKVGDGNSSSRREVKVVVGGGAGGGCGGGSGGSGGGDEDDGWCWDANHTSMDVYYESMIEANPGNYMILSNYARFLKEIRGDFLKAEEYFGRAILENPNCGNVLSLYADLIWKKYEDAKRAHIYYDRAVKAEPDNSYVMASYARFLWDAEDEIEDQH